MNTKQINFSVLIEKINSFRFILEYKSIIDIAESNQSATLAILVKIILKTSHFKEKLLFFNYH